jgi:hypothetical protein
VDLGDLQSAKTLTKKLKDLDFYIYCSDKCKKIYKDIFEEKQFIEKFKL